jgi:hypothetical protein
VCAHLRCYVSNAGELGGCQTPAECAASAACSTMSALVSRAYTPPLMEGRCVVPFAPSLPTHIAQGTQTLYCPGGGGPVGSFGCWVPGIDGLARSESACAALGGTMQARWVELPRSRATCEVPLGCAVTSTLVTGSLLPYSAMDCTACRGRQEVGVWEQGRWLGGRVRRAEWTQRQLLNRTSWESDSLNYELMATYIQLAAQEALQESRLTQFVCRRVQLLEAVTFVMCACPDVVPEDLGYFKCSADLQGGTRYGVLLVCRDSGGSIRLPPLEMLVPPRSLVSDADALHCALVLVDVYPEAVFRVRSKGKLGVSFARERPTGEVGSYESVVNRDGLFSGVVLGEGVQFTSEESAGLVRVRNASVCLELSLPWDQARFPRLDLGRVRADGRVEPLQLPDVRLDGSLACTTLMLDDVHDSLVPIGVVADYSAQGSGALSSGEKALMYVMGALYSVLLVCALLFSLPGARLMVAAGWVVYVFVALFAVFRAVYFFLFATDQVGSGDSENAGEYVLFELPTFFYCSVVALVAVSFVFLYRSRGGERTTKRRYFWITYLLVNLVLYLIFVLVVVLFKVLVVDGADPTCNGRLDDEGNVDEAARALRISYRATLGAVALITLLFIAYTGYRIWRQTHSPVVLQALFISLALLCNCVAFLVYYAVARSSPYFVLSMVFTEFLPLLVLIVLLSPLRQLISSNTSKSFDPSATTSSFTASPTRTHTQKTDTTHSFTSSGQS